MAEIASRFEPIIKRLKSYPIHFNWEALFLYLKNYSFRIMVIVGLCPLFVTIPAVMFYFGLEYSTFSFFALSIIMLVPWLLIPFLFIQYITERSKAGKIISYVVTGLVLVAFIIWVYLFSLWKLF